MKYVFINYAIQISTAFPVIAIILQGTYVDAVLVILDLRGFFNTKYFEA